MSDLHVFQRYSQKENVVTNNTLRLLGHVYQDRPARLERLLERLIDGISLDVGVQMTQQTTSATSVPDGALTQSAFRIVLETKRGSRFSLDQLVRHAEGMKAGTPENATRVLLLLLKNADEVDEAEVQRRVEAVAPGTSFAAVTFQDLIDALIGEDPLSGEEPLIETHEDEMRDLVDDYVDFCAGERLFPVDDLMRAVPCGTTHADNARHDLYYAPASRGYRRHRYVGIYFKKCIRYLGEIDRIVPVNRVDGALVVQGAPDENDLTDAEAERIRGAMDDAKAHGYNVDTGHEFFLVDTFHKTGFKKTSKYGMAGARYFRLREILDLDEGVPLPETDELARRLEEKTWT